MKDSNNRLLLGLTALFGTVGAGLYVLVMNDAIDHKGLLLPLHPANLGLWAVSLGFVALMWFLVKGRLGENGTYGDSFPQCRIRFGLSLAAGALLACESVQQLAGGNALVGVLGLLAAVGMAMGGLCRMQGKRPLPLYHILVCLFFIARLVTSFQSWSADPQFQDYAMQLLASVSLMLFAFHRASSDADLMDREALARSSLFGAYFSMVSLSDAAMPLLYAAGALWAIGAGPDLKRLAKED